MADFFISFSHHDKPWADWIAWNLDRNGYSVIYQPWHFVPGSNFVLEMDVAGRATKRTISVLSPNYLNSIFTLPEWATAFASDPVGAKRKLLPVRIMECDLTGSLLAQIVYIDLVGKTDEADALSTLLNGIRGDQPAEKPEYPSPNPAFTSRLPGSVDGHPSWLYGGSVGRDGETLDLMDNLPPPGMKVALTPPFVPPLFRAVRAYSETPLRLDFLLDCGHTDPRSSDLIELATRLTKYFLTSLSLPESDQWVNLSPYQADQIISKNFGTTGMGIDLLGQDYVLKQLTASLMYPEWETGKKYWNSAYEKYREKGNLTDTEVNTFNKVWVVPDFADIVEDEGLVFIADCGLKPLLEEDYLTLRSELGKGGRWGESVSEAEAKDVSGIASDACKQVLLPLIRNEVNTGSNFAVLRQIFHSMILATWFKRTLRNSFISEIYANKSKLSTLSERSEADVLGIYNQYLTAFDLGIFNYIREEYEPSVQDIIPRKYFAGGFNGAETAQSFKTTTGGASRLVGANSGNGHMFWVEVDLLCEDGHGPDGPSPSGGPETPGGIDMAPRLGFDLNVEKVGSGFTYQLDSDALERLKKIGVRGLKPRIISITPVIS